MGETSEGVTSRIFGPGIHIPFLTRVPLLVTIVLFVTLADIAIPGSMQEALRYSMLDQPHQLFVIAIALLMACVAVRFTAEAMIELVSPALLDEPGFVGLLAKALPRAFALFIGAAAGTPLIELAFSMSALPHGRHFAAVGLGALYVAIGLAVAILPKGPHAPTFSQRATNPIMRWIYALLPLLLAIAFAGAVLGVWQKNSGIADRALERYVTAIVGVGDDGSSANGPLETYVLDRTGAPIDRYTGYVKPAPYAMSTVSPFMVVAELVSLFVSCIAARLALAIFFDLIFQELGSGGVLSRLIRGALPRLASAALGIALAAQFLREYLGPPVAVNLSAAEKPWLWGIAIAYAAIGLLASIGSGSSYAADGPWRESPSVGRRFLGAARRISSIDRHWKWILGLLGLTSIGIFLLFANLHHVGIPQYLGPVGVILLWGSAASVLFFPLAYLSHMTRIPTLTILLLAAVTFAGFDLNDNHELRVARGTAPSWSEALKASAATTDQRHDLDLADWISSRADWDRYDHYPVFLVATEGGGIRAAYFTSSVLAALQERCPAFAQHTLAISGVSGGSVGAAVFAGLAGDHASNVRDPGCNLEGVKQPGPIIKRARAVLSTDLLSPLLGAMLFPDALQRIIPFPIPQTDRSRAIEFAVEDSWRKSTTGDCGRCDRSRMSERAADLYTAPAPGNAVPNLFLNTTEAGTGRIIPYATVRVVGLATPFRSQAEIDDGMFDNVKPQPNLIERVSLQDRMANDRIPLSTAAIVSARFPYLTPAGLIGYSGGEYVDGGYFENSGTWLLSGLVQYLIGQQLSYPAGKSPQLDAARKAVFIVIVIQSEPCTRDSIDAGCEEDAATVSNSWNEVLSPVRALLSTRDMRAEYSYDNLNAVSAMIEQFSAKSTPQAAAPDNASTCDYPVCAVTLRFRNRTRTDIPLSWVLSSQARNSMDAAVDGMEQADVRHGAPPASISLPDDTQDIDRVLGSYRRVLCVLAATQGSQACGPATGPATTQESAKKHAG